MKSFMNLLLSQSTLMLLRGWNLFNRNTLDRSQILVTTPEIVQKECDAILQSRGITPNVSTRSVLNSQQNLLNAGSGCLSGGAYAAQWIAKTASILDLSGFTASGLMSSMYENEKKNNAQRSNHEIKAAKPLSCDYLMKR
jgi:hypothetical protein